MRAIAILSDLGTKDYFVGAMKGAILSVNPDAKIVDLSHEIPKRDIRVGAFVLAHAAQTFPKGSIFVAVVDPGVGTKRRCVLLETDNGLFFIGPDNGLFTLVAERFGVSRVHEITNRALMRREVSPTFHGRDLMAPVAAHLSLGIDPAEVGPKLEGIEKLEIPRPRLTEDGIHGCALNIDDFGNLITNIDADMISRFADFGDELNVEIDDRVLAARFVRTFGDVGEGECLCYIGSAGMLELAERAGDLARKLKVKIGCGIRIRRWSGGQARDPDR